MSLMEIYSAESTTEAHLIKNLLEQHGIDAHVSGYYLQGGFGELPVINMIQVMVDDSDANRARDIIDDYQSGKFSIDESDFN